jgi:serine/threonine protein phosphatase PrpC
MNIYSISKKGMREHNEDYETIYINSNNNDIKSKKINIFGIYDGHGGKYISKYLSEKIPDYFKKNDVQYPLSGRYVRNVFKEIQNDLEKNHSSYSEYCGSTCLLAIDYIHEQKRFIDIINLGDSRCVISRGNKANIITSDHKPNWPTEKERIKKMGGEIYFDGADWRIGDLSVSRAFGDLDNKPYISCVPDIYRYKLSKKDQFMVLACDGLWDVMDGQYVVNFIITNCYDSEYNRINKKTNIARLLAENALKKGSTDNITIIIVFF